MYELIQHQRLESNASSITFSNIPQIYTDLYLVTSLRAAGGVEYDESRLFFNGVNSNLSAIDFNADGYSIYTFSVANGFAGVVNGSNSTANGFSNQQIYISNYSSSSLKSYSVESVAEGRLFGVGYLDLASGLWNQTAPITSVTLTAGGGSNWLQNSSATLYGVNRTAGRGRPKAIGGNISYSNGYWLHTFTGSGTFSSTQTLSVDALVVAGGGAGRGNGNSDNSGDGGSAGQMLQLSGVLLTGPSSIPVLVGSGGPGVAGGVGSTGGTSAFGTSQATGGAGGVNQSSSVPRAGGSGAGGPALTPGANTGGDGGPGLPWNGAYYAGGGGGGFSFGGNGGIGGGGRGESYNTGNGAAGTANTGGGGGGKSSTGLNPGYNGGSGVVIIRYRAD